MSYHNPLYETQRIVRDARKNCTDSINLMVGDLTDRLKNIGIDLDHKGNDKDDQEGDSDGDVGVLQSYYKKGGDVKDLVKDEYASDSSFISDNSS